MASLKVDAIRCVTETDEAWSDDIYLVTFQGNTTAPFDNDAIKRFTPIAHTHRTPTARSPHTQPTLRLARPNSRTVLAGVHAVRGGTK